MNDRIPLATLLSFLLVAFTIEFDNEAERRMRHRTTRDPGSVKGPWLVSLAMWSNCMRLVHERGITAAELERLACAAPNLHGMRRWGYIVIDDDGLIRATQAGRAAQAIWRPLFGEIESRWVERFGETVALLRAKLASIVATFDVELPEALPILGRGLVNRAPRCPRPPERASEPPLSALLAKVLLAFALSYERDAAISLPIGANVLRVVDEEGVRMRDLRWLSGVSKESVAMAIGFLCNRECAVVETQNRVKRVRLTERGLGAKHGYATRLSKVEDSWRNRFGSRNDRRPRQGARPHRGITRRACAATLRRPRALSRKLARESRAAANAAALPYGPTPRWLSRRQLSLVANQRVALRREHKVAFGQPSDFMRPDVDAQPSPRHLQIGMMLLLLGHVADPRRVVHRLREVFEAVGAGEKLDFAAFGIVAFDHVPARTELSQQWRNLRVV